VSDPTAEERRAAHSYLVGLMARELGAAELVRLAEGVERFPTQTTVTRTAAVMLREMAERA
jgi:hypothetical protein